MRESAGILLYRFNHERLEFFLVHPGGPFWRGKEEGAWTIPKGEIQKEEDPLETAIREFKEETGFDVTGPFLPLFPVKQKAGKVVHAWAAAGDVDPLKIVSNSFKMEWPPKSGKWISVPEIDKAAWCDAAEAVRKLNVAQASFIDDLKTRLKV